MAGKPLVLPLRTVPLPTRFRNVLQYSTWEYDPYTDSLLVIRQSQRSYHDQELVRYPLRSGARNFASFPGSRDARTTTADGSVEQVICPHLEARHNYGLASVRGGNGVVLVTQSLSLLGKITVKLELYTNSNSNSNSTSNLAGENVAWSVSRSAEWVESACEQVLPLRYASRPCDFILIRMKSRHSPPRQHEARTWTLYDDRLNKLWECVPSENLAHHTLAAGSNLGELVVLGVHPMVRGADGKTSEERNGSPVRSCVVRLPPHVVALLGAHDITSSTPTTTPSDTGPVIGPAITLKEAPTLRTWRVSPSTGGMAYALLGDPDTDGTDVVVAGGSDHVWVHVTQAFTNPAISSSSSSASIKSRAGTGAGAGGSAAGRLIHVTVGAPTQVSEERVVRLNIGSVFDDNDCGGDDEGDDETEEFYRLTLLPSLGCVAVSTTKRLVMLRVRCCPWSRELHANGWTGPDFRQWARALLRVRWVCMAAYAGGETPTAVASPKQPGAWLAQLPDELVEMVISAAWQLHQLASLTPA